MERGCLFRDVGEVGGGGEEKAVYNTPEPGSRREREGESKEGEKEGAGDERGAD